MQTLNIHVGYDRAERLWTVEASDIPGLNVEASSYEELVAIVLDAAPDLMGSQPGQDASAPMPVAFRHVEDARRVRHA